jgi:hypothetical protein
MTACCAAIILWTIPAAADPNSSDAKKYHETVAERTSRLMAEYRVRRSEQLKERASEGNVQILENGDGPALLTNRGHLYKRGGYKDVTETYFDVRPITVPNRFKKTTVAGYASGDLQTLVTHYSKFYGLDRALVLAVIRAESNFNPNAVSHAGASGLMQLMPGTAKDMGVTKIFDPAQNIAGGTQYLSKCLELYRGNTKLALAAYNAGPGAVKAHGGIPPYKETQNYITSVLRFYDEYAGGKAPRVQQARTLKFNPAVKRDHNNDSAYNVHFMSGLIQPADRVDDGDNGYYVIEYQGRAWQVLKKLVKEVVESA